MEFTYIEAIFTGALQGITELFPISSLGHSVLVPNWIGGTFASLVTEKNSPWLTITVALHFASALALFWIFRKRWFSLLANSARSMARGEWRDNHLRTLSLIIVATLPVAILGVVFGDYFQENFGKPLPSAIFLTCNGVILVMVERITRKRNQLNSSARETPFADAEIAGHISLPNAVAIGLAQSTALFAGISRFGITISAGLVRGLSHKLASEFAFLLALPVILGASIIKLPTLFDGELKNLWGPVLLGSIISYIATYASVKFLVRWFKNNTLYPFALYCLVFGAISIVKFA